MNDKNPIIEKIYRRLLKEYGQQGWWPVMDNNREDTTVAIDFRGYHPADYSYPKTKKQQFEICVGAILTQNTAWTNVEKALLNLKKENALSPQRINNLADELISSLIRPAGYFNQKTIYIKTFASFYLSLEEKTPTREEVLSCKGVGNETADSIMLYAFSKPEFVIDTYTKRIFSHLDICKNYAKYVDLKNMFENSIERDVEVYQEYHALIVEHAKRYYNKKPYGNNKDFLKLI